MGNPWKGIRLSDYESHMSLEEVGQLQELSRIMKGQFSEFASESAMILGVAGGNGLEHVSRDKYQTVYGRTGIRDKRSRNYMERYHKDTRRRIQARRDLQLQRKRNV